MLVGQALSQTPALARVMVVIVSITAVLNRQGLQKGKREEQKEGEERKGRRKNSTRPSRKGHTLDAGRFSRLTEPFSGLRLAFRDWKSARAHQCTV